MVSAAPALLVVVHVAVVRQALVAMLLLPLGAVLGHVRTLEVLALVLVVRATVALAALLVDVLAVLLRGARIMFSCSSGGTYVISL